ncbi:MAG: SMC-Scp complex subunit ScpB, partial [Planctomycetota bacterium]
MSCPPDDRSTVHVEPKASDPPTDPSAETPCADQPLAKRVEALLVSADRPLGEGRLAQLMGLPESDATSIRAAIDELNSTYEQSGRSFRAERLAGGWQILTLAEFGPLMARLHGERQQSRLSHAALETLAIVAYRQPILRAEIEAIRGVSCGDMLRGLLERRLIKIAGRAEELGRPMLYGTTREFLRVFGLSSLEDLPAVAGLPGGAAQTGGGATPPA